MAAIGGFRSDLSITRKTDGNFGNVSAGVLFTKVAYQRGDNTSRGRLFCEPASSSLEPRASVCEPQKIPAKKSKTGHNALIWHLLHAGTELGL